MKILIVIDQFEKSNNGTTISARRFAEHLKRRGNEVYVLSTGKSEKDKYVVKELKLLPIANKIIKSQGMTFAMPNSKVLKEAISKVDVVHFYMPFLLSIKGLKIAEKLNVPHTTAFHVQPENITYTIKLGKNKIINDEIYEIYKKTFYDRFTHIHCPSKFIASELKKHGYKAKLHVISNGVEDIFKYNKDDKKENKKFFITMVGRFSGEKRQDLLINAIANSKYEKDIQLVLAGKGPKYRAYKKMSEKLTNEPIMKFYKLDELLDLLSKTDLYVHTSDAEIEAISCLEAIACGNVPVIANSQKSATPQFALDERSLFGAGNVDELKEKIEYWIEHKDELKDMQKKYAESAEKYRIDKSMEKIERMFQNAINESKETK